MKRKKNRFLNFLLSAALLFLLIRAALYDSLVARQYTIATPLVSSAHTFVLVTDLHATVYGEGQRKLIGTIKRYSPEAVFLVGDIADDKRDFSGTAEFLQAASTRFSCYYVTGNHERWVEYTDDIKELIRSYGVEVLDESSAPVTFGDGEICLFGLDDPLFYPNSTQYATLLSGFDTSEDRFDLLLAHRPEFYDQYLAAGFDLTLCGHAHGGQVRIPFLMNGLYAPNQGYFPKHAGGLYQSDSGQTVIVSRGMMKNEIPRIFNPPEVCVIQIIPEE